MPVPFFSPGEVYTASAANSIGLWLVKSQTVGTGVTSVTVTDAFSADYDNYRIVISGISTSFAENGYVLLYTNTSGATYSTSITWRNFSTNALNGAATSAGTGGVYLGLTGSSGGTCSTTDVYRPFLATRTSSTSSYVSDQHQGYCGGIDTNAVSQTGFTVSGTGGITLTGGTIRVYGYRN